MRTRDNATRNIFSSSTEREKPLTARECERSSSHRERESDMKRALTNCQNNTGRVAKRAGSTVQDGVNF